jgi:hypothetical protein
MIWHDYRLSSLMYRRTTSLSTLPTVSAKYPSAQRLSPYKNSSRSRHSFLSYHPTHSPFQSLHHFCHSTLRFRLDDKMHVVLLDIQFTDPPAIDLACLVQQPLHADGHFTSQHAARADDISVSTPDGTASGVSYDTQSDIWP